MVILQRNNFDTLITVLQEQGYTVLAPVARDGAIMYDEISSSGELPIGYTDEHDAKTYRLHKGSSGSLFGYVLGPSSWKKFLFPPVFRLMSAKRNGKTFETTNGDGDVTRQYAFLGVRSCELQAILIQDKVFNTGEYIDPHYKDTRDKSFMIAVNCTKAGGTCFCSSMNTGPKATTGFDLALTEVYSEQEHHFILEAGSDRGRDVLAQLALPSAGRKAVEEADRLVQAAAQQMGRAMDTTNVPAMLQTNFEHPHWDEVAKRCLACANCTLVCPTCFCTTIEDVTDLAGTQAHRVRKWDSCFTMDFSYIHGGSIRPSVKARYRQWLSHKLANWNDQFGTSGCVGCGRCISWCPAGIDITEEVRIMQQTTQTEPSTISV